MQVYVEAEHREELVQVSNTVVGPLNEVAESVEAVHALLRRATDPGENKRAGVLGLLGLSGGVVPDSITEARNSLQAADLPPDQNVQELLDAANALLATYEGFIPVHADLSKKIISAAGLTPDLTSEVNRGLVGLEYKKTQSIEAFTQVQHKFLR